MANKLRLPLILRPRHYSILEAASIFAPLNLSSRPYSKPEVATIAPSILSSRPYTSKLEASSSNQNRCDPTGNVPVSVGALNSSSPLHHGSEKPLSIPHSDMDIFKAKLNATLKKTMEGKHYDSVQVLLLNWKDHDLGPVIAKETKELEYVFKNSYGFETEYLELHGAKAQHRLGQRLFQIGIDRNPKQKQLFILYYNGHGTKDKNGGLIWTA